MWLNLERCIVLGGIVIETCQKMDSVVWFAPNRSAIERESWLYCYKSCHNQVKTPGALVDKLAQLIE